MILMLARNVKHRGAVKTILIQKVVIGICVATLIGGCGSTLLEGRKIDYKSAGKLPSLEIPPDLTAPSTNEKYSVPDIDPRGSATYSVYSKERTVQPAAGSDALLPMQSNVQIERAGSQRWLVVQWPPEDLWPIVKEFWRETGFIINVEIPEAGIMETDWAEDRAKIPQTGLKNLLGKLIDSVSSTAERDKFRTRLERGQKSDTTEIYISHRGMHEVLQGNARNQTVWQPRPSNPELEAEMLRRLMVRFGVEDARAQAQLTSINLVARAKLIQARDGNTLLTMLDSFDRAWRRVGLALDRVGFTVEDRDRSSGLYFVRYIDPETDTRTENKGILSKLAFWRSNKAKNNSEQYRIFVNKTSDGSEVTVLSKDGKAEKSKTATRILSLLHEQLK